MGAMLKDQDRGHPQRRSAFIPLLLCCDTDLRPGGLSNP